MSRQKSQDESDEETPWDFYLYVGITLLGWSFDMFLRATPKHFMQQWIYWLKSNAPDTLDLSSEEPTYYVDEVPLFRH